MTEAELQIPGPDISSEIPEGDFRSRVGSDSLNLNDLEERDQKAGDEKLGSVQFVLKRRDYILLIVFFMMNPILSFLRGTKFVHSMIGIKRCSIPDSLFVLGYLILNLIITAFSYREVNRRNSLVVSDEKQLVFRPVDTLALIFFIFLIGIISGFISTGLAALFTMVLISFKLDPFVSSSTSILLTCLTTGSSSILFYLKGKIYPSALIINGVVIVAVVCLTRLTVYKRIFAQRKSSTLVLCIVLILAISIPSNVLKIVPKLIRMQRGGESIWSFGSICE